MKLFAVTICARREATGETILLCSEHELSTFGFFQRGSIREFMNFFAKTISERTELGQRQSVEKEDYVAHAYTRFDGLSGVLIADKEYPVRVAYSLLNKMLEEFSSRMPSSTWIGPLVYPPLRDYLHKYQDPRQADTILKVQQELDETKIVLHKTIESVLQRGEHLDSLIQKSDMLSGQSKTFYKAAKKQNSCCSVM